MNANRLSISKTLCVVLMQLAFTKLACADSLSLPLEGYYHPGRAMPVRWERSSAAENSTTDTDLILQANGAITVSIPVSRGSHGVFPLMTIDRRVSDIQSSRGAINVINNLRPLDDPQRLIAITLEDDSLAPMLFPGALIVPIHFSGVHPIEGPSIAWQTLDALITSPDVFSRIPRQTRDGLFLAGVVLAVKGDWPPDDLLPHQRIGPLTVARFQVPLPPLNCPDGYAPIEGWSPGRNADFRRHIFLLGTVYLILFFGCLLIRQRWIIYGVFAMSAFMCALFAWDNSRQSPIARISGIVAIHEPTAKIGDQWIYFASPATATARFSAGELCEPVLFDRAQAARLNLVLHCDQDGSPVFFSATMQAREALALCSRQPEIREMILQNTLTSPLRFLAGSAAYPDCIMVGEDKVTAPDGAFPTIAIKRWEEQLF